MNKLQHFNVKNIMIPTGKKKADFFGLKVGVDKLTYCQFGRVYLNGNKGTFYKLCGNGYPYKNPLTEQEQREYTERYSNVTFFNGGAQYAPEMRFSYLFLADKAFQTEIA